MLVLLLTSPLSDSQKSSSAVLTIQIVKPVNSEKIALKIGHWDLPMASF